MNKLAVLLCHRHRFLGRSVKSNILYETRQQRQMRFVCIEKLTSINSWSQKWYKYRQSDIMSPHNVCLDKSVRHCHRAPRQIECTTLKCCLSLLETFRCVSRYSVTNILQGSFAPRLVTTKDGGTWQARQRYTSMCNLVTRISAWSWQCSLFIFPFFFSRFSPTFGRMRLRPLLICPVECHQVILFRSFLLPWGEFIAMVNA